jgi:hypothetical protein
LDAAEGAFAAVKARRATLRPAEKLQAFRR